MVGSHGAAFRRRPDGEPRGAGGVVAACLEKDRAFAGLSAADRLTLVAAPRAVRGRRGKPFSREASLGFTGFGCLDTSAARLGRRRAPPVAVFAGSAPGRPLAPRGGKLCASSRGLSCRRPTCAANCAKRRRCPSCRFQPQKPTPYGKPINQKACPLALQRSYNGGWGGPSPGEPGWWPAPRRRRPFSVGKNRAWYIAGAHWQPGQAFVRLIAHAIQTASQEGKVFDFMGSYLPGIERFFRQFGGAWENRLWLRRIGFLGPLG